MKISPLLKEYVLDHQQQEKELNMYNNPHARLVYSIILQALMDNDIDWLKSKTCLYWCEHINLDHNYLVTAINNHHSMNTCPLCNEKYINLITTKGSNQKYCPECKIKTRRTKEFYKLMGEKSNG